MKKKLIVSLEEANAFIWLTDVEAGQLIKALCAHIYDIGSYPTNYLKKPYIKILYPYMKKEVERNSQMTN